MTVVIDGTSGINTPGVVNTAAETIATTLAVTGVTTLQGLTVGKGGGAVATNTAVGQSAMAATATGTENTALGREALTALLSGGQNVGLGRSALAGNTTGSSNTGVGTGSLVSNTTGSFCTSIGAGALNSNNTASFNTAVGYQAGYTTTTGTYNTVLGYQALYSNSTGASNVALGEEALKTNTAADNTAVGSGAMFANTTGTVNTAIGRSAGGANTTGAQNIFIGLDSGNATLSHTTGSYNTFIGRCNGSSAASTNQLVITASVSVIAGKGDSTGFISPSGGGVYQGNNSSTWSQTSDRRLKKNIVDNNTGLEKLTQIQVRNFEYRLPEEVTDLPQDQAIAKNGVQLGVIAQELQQVLPECVKTESTGVMTVDTDNLTWYLINAVKELTARVKQLEEASA